MHTLVLGLGNTLLGDEGIGVHVVHRLKNEYDKMDSVTYLDGGTLSFTLASFVEEADNLVIIDAAQLHRSAGDISIFEGKDMDLFVTGNRNKSVHEVNITDILALAHLTGHLPARRALVGVQPRFIDWSSSLSRPVQSAIPKVCKLTHELIIRWHRETMIETA